MSLQGWESLKCVCGSTSFIATHELKWKTGEGTTQRQSGWQCSGCKQVVDSGKLIQQAQIRQRQQQIKELEGEKL